MGRSYVPFGLNLSKNNYLRKIKFVNRAANRFPELNSIPKTKILLPEIFYQVGVWLTRKSLNNIGDFFISFSFQIYSLIVNYKLQKDNSEIIIIRCGFGSHIKVPNKLRICDLGMAHPYLDVSLVSGEGFTLASEDQLNRVSKLMLRDLEIADRIIVNSEFIKKTCIAAGIDELKIFVVYLPPAQEFIDHSNAFFINSNKANEDLSVLYAGILSYRKGIDILLKLAEICEVNDLNIKFTVIGNWSGVNHNFRAKFLKMSNITWLPWVNRSELISYYAKSNFLFFPTRADGGARVITEAMLFGNIVLTSTVSGSPITSGHDGFEFEIGNESQFIANALSVLRNHEKNIAVGLNAIDTAKNRLSYENYMKNLLKCCISK